MAEAVGAANRGRAVHPCGRAVRCGGLLLHQLRAVDRRTPSWRARARVPARLCPAARAAARSGAHRSPADRPAQRSRIRTTRESRKAWRVRRCGRSHRRHGPWAGNQRPGGTRGVPAPGAWGRQRGARDRAKGAAATAGRPRPQPRARQQTGRAIDAGCARAHRAHDRRAREAPPRRAVRHSRPHDPGGARHRGSSFLRSPGRRSDWRPRRRVLVPDRPALVPRWRQHHHPAARAQRVPAEIRGDDTAGRACADVETQGAGDLGLTGPDPARVEGRDSGDVLERHPAGTARIVRHHRRAGSGAPVFR